MIADSIVFLHDGHAVLHNRMETLGDDRPDNIFEVRSSLTKLELKRCLADLEDLSVEDFASLLIVRVSKSIAGTTILQRLLAAGAEVKLFRDASKSTRRLFDREVAEL
jgi:hypothetical protein